MLFEEKYFKYKIKYLIEKNKIQNQIGGKEQNIIYSKNIDNISQKNNYFRKVLFTTKNMQLVVMSLLPDENIPLEIHKDHDQFIKIEKGYGVAIIGNTNKKKVLLQKGDCIIIPKNTYHEIKNIGNTKLKLYTIYTPPEHDAYRIDKKKSL
jgi:mannose-6-phosphate isomerase-like protein (cupin superfamily)